MTLTEGNDNHPDWVVGELGLEKYKEFTLGQKITHSKESVFIIHIQEVDGDVFFRLKLDNGASITGLYKLIKKDNPVASIDNKISYKNFVELFNEEDVYDIESAISKAWNLSQNAVENAKEEPKRIGKATDYIRNSSASQ